MGGFERTPHGRAVGAPALTEHLQSPLQCYSVVVCSVSGQPPTTLAEFTIGGSARAGEFYDMSVIDGYNLMMAFSCSTGVGLVCTSPTCPAVRLFASDDCRRHKCAIATTTTGEAKLPDCQGLPRMPKIEPIVLILYLRTSVSQSV